MVGATRLTWADVDRAATACAAGLQTRGLEPGERVGLFLGNRPEFVIGYFGALRAGLRRRRGLVILAWIGLAVAVVYAVYGFLNQRGYLEEILGYPVPVGATTFGTFINRNHAGIYFYLNAAIAVALTFWHLRRTQASVTRGGPYLLAAFCAAFLGLFVFFTTSIGASIMGLVLLAVVTPLAYFLGTPKEALALIYELKGLAD